MIRKVKNYIQSEKMINGGETVLAGVSGGADSVCLFFILKELSKDLSFNMEVIHINHMIRDVAENDAVFVEKLCQKYDIPYHRRDIDIPKLYKENGQSEEEAGRIARYEAFEEIADEIAGRTGGKVLIATAHNMNDQAETMLHNLFRGSRIKGLSGIKSKRVHGRHEVIRPLLVLSRDEIEDYLNNIGQNWCTDETNNTDEFTRNRIRHRILPFAEKEINAGATRHAAEAANYLSRIDDYLDEEAEKLLERSFVDNSESMDCRILSEVSDIIAERAVMQAIKRIAPGIKDIQAVHIGGIIEMIKDQSGSARLDLPYGIKAIRTYEKLRLIVDNYPEKKNNFPKLGRENEKNQGQEFLTITKKELEEKGEISADIEKIGKVKLQLKKCNGSEEIPTGQYTKWFDYDKIIGTVSLRNRKEGDVLRTSVGEKKLKKLMIDEKIPADMRNGMIIFADEKEVIWLPGVRINDRYKIDGSTHRILAIEVTKLQFISSKEELK